MSGIPLDGTVSTAVVRDPVSPAQGPATSASDGGAAASARPGRVRRFIAHGLGRAPGTQLLPPELRRIVSNMGWLMGERITQMALGMFVTVWMARYLGPESFGQLSYAMALVALLGFLSYLGLDAIVTRRLVLEPDQRDRLLGTTVVLRLLGGLCASVSLIIFAFLRPGGAESRWLIVVLAIGSAFDAFDAVDLWFQSRVRSKVSVTVRTVSLVGGAAARIGLILSGAPLIAFAAATAGQQVLKALLFIVAYVRDDGSPARWRPSAPLSRELLSQSWPLILSSAGALVYLKIDQVMLKEMVGPAEVGIYAVAARVSEVWYFLPLIVASSMFPSMVKTRETDPEAYRRRAGQAFAWVAWLAFGIATLVSLLAEPVIALLYGDQYRSAAPILVVHVWACPAVFMGAVLSKWLVAEGLLIFSLTRHGLGAVVNVVLNLLLIPFFGGLGAAIATLISYTVSSWLACYTDRRTRPAAHMMTAAVLSPFRLVPALIGQLVRGTSRRSTS
jgi:O-antigen/teichoic acid export membrane protein